MAPSATTRPWRTIGVLAALVAVLYGTIGAGSVWDKAQWTPKLALDLDGGTEFVLDAVPRPGTKGTVTSDTMAQALQILRARVNGSGVSEADVALQGSSSIVVTLPGSTIDQATRESLQRSAAMEFRPVLQEVGAPVVTPTPTGAASAGSTPSATGAALTPPSASAAPSAAPSAVPTSAGTPAVTASSNGMPLPRALLATTPSPTGSPAAAASATGAPSPTGAVPPSAAAAAGSPTAKPTDASDLNWVTPQLTADLAALDCGTAKARGVAQRRTNDPAKPLVACDSSGDKYVLGPVEVEGQRISSASAGLETNSQGQTGTAWQVNLGFDGLGSDQFGKVTARLVNLPSPRNQFAIVLDNQVVSAPRTLSAITGGQAQITGNFTQDSATSLANQLKFGALPVSFEVTKEQTISATLGDEQLRRGLLAGLIGLVLVVVYSLFQYRALGLVTVSSLAIAALITYGFVVLLGWRQGLRLSLAGVAGLIVSIGITADSFIVYFERVRDEVRDGRGLRAAVEQAWVRARRTIMISDAVSFLAAVVLYLLAVGGVRGFAFTLGLTTLVDLLVVFLFTKPVVTLISRTRFFGGGHRLSGFDAEHLGRAVSYAGRGQVRAPAAAGAGTIAERRAAAEKGRTATLLAEPGDPGDGDSDADVSAWTSGPSNGKDV